MKIRYYLDTDLPGLESKTEPAPGPEPKAREGVAPSNMRFCCLAWCFCFCDLLALFGPTSMWGANVAVISICTVKALISFSDVFP